MLGTPKIRAAAAAVGMLLLLGSLAACGGGEDRPGSAGSASGSVSASGATSGSDAKEAEFGKSEADTVVPVRFADYAFVDLPASVKGPKVFFEAKNEGKEEHELVILKDGKELIELEAIAPGKSGTLAVELEPGAYTVECHVEKDGKKHTELGMKATFTVTS